MIQRIQSVFLLLVALLSLALMYVPIYEIVPSSPVAEISAPALGDSTSLAATSVNNPINDKKTITSNTLLTMINGAIILFSLVAIFLFKNRNLQIRLCNLTLLIECIFLGLAFFSVDSVSSAVSGKVHFLYGIYLPMMNAVLLFLAIRRIKHDENLVRSADRLR